MERSTCQTQAALAFRSCLAASAAPGITALAQPAKPEVAFIPADNVGYGDLGCYGGELLSAPTPRIDHTRVDHMCGRLFTSMELSGEKRCNSQRY